ncbi:MAG: hypothetical protein WCI03_13995 [bacterium]
MTKQNLRLNKLEQKTPPFKREFIAWEGNAWMPEEKAESIRQDPNGRIFWKSILDEKEKQTK